MSEKVVPLIHVPDVRAAVEWYTAIGFTVTKTHDDGEGLRSALLSFGSSELMFDEGGLPSTSDRQGVDLYVYADDVDELYRRLQDRVEVVEGVHDTVYGMREFIIRDLNRFWVTFGQPALGVDEGLPPGRPQLGPFGQLMAALLAVVVVGLVIVGAAAMLSWMFH
jgi:catechol 2,3-dioxygenase-like lactoylglutathione lyase family enzyme